MRSGPTALVVGGVAYSLIAASTTPFTLPADVLTGLAIVAMAVLVIVRWPLHTRSRSSSSSSVSTSTSSLSSLPAGTAGSGGRTAHRYLPWLLLLIVFVAWELFNYLVHGTRANHPTFSSITDANDRFYILKALLFMVWLASGWVIIGRGSRQRAPRRAESTPGETHP
jgi:hypothetical protein